MTDSEMFTNYIGHAARGRGLLAAGEYLITALKFLYFLWWVCQLCIGIGYLIWKLSFKNMSFIFNELLSFMMKMT